MRFINEFICLGFLCATGSGFAKGVEVPVLTCFNVDESDIPLPSKVLPLEVSQDENGFQHILVSNRFSGSEEILRLNVLYAGMPFSGLASTNQNDFRKFYLGIVDTEGANYMVELTVNAATPSNVGSIAVLRSGPIFGRSPYALGKFVETRLYCVEQ